MVKKNINKILIILIILNAIVIYFALGKTYSKKQTIKLSGEDNIIKEIEISYDIQANPLAKIEVEDLSKTNAGINSCVGNIGQSINISGNFFNFQLKDAQVNIKYDETKLNDIPEEAIGVLWYDKENEQMIEIKSEIDTEKKEIRFQTNHFSEYILINLETWRSEWNKRLVRERDENASSFDISFVIDDSGSMTDNDPKDARLAACEDFVKILRNKDGYSVVLFEYSGNTVQELTKDKSKVKEAIGKFNSNGGTDIAAGLEEGMKSLEKSESKSKVVVLLTDGEDSGLTSRKNDIVLEALENNITIYSIFLNAADKEINANNTVDIQDIANGTGGKFYYISSDEVIDIFNSISKEAVGIENGKDSDGDGIIDEIEIGGIRNQFGEIIYLDPYNADTDGDGMPDNIEIGEKEETADGAVYYRLKSNPLVADNGTKQYITNRINTEFENGTRVLGRWDSGFRLKKNGFKFHNISVNYNGGVCAGISYLAERTFNKEPINHSISSTQIPDVIENDDPYESLNNYPEMKSLISTPNIIFWNNIYNRKDTEDSKEKHEKQDKKNIENMKKNPSIHTIEDVELAKAICYTTDPKEIEEIYKEKILYFYNKVDTFNVEDENIKNGNLYFYKPTGALKKDSRFISYEDQIKDNADGNLVRELLYYWMYENNITHKAKNDYEIDFSNPITDETIARLKNIFLRKQIIRVDIKGHTINGYALEKVSETEYKLYVYDSNYPAQENKKTFIRLIKKYGENVYIVGQDKIYCCEGSDYLDSDGTFELVLEKDNEIINYKKIKK